MSAMFSQPQSVKDLLVSDLQMSCITGHQECSPSNGCQGPASISDKMSYCKIAQSLEAARFVFRIVQSL